VPLETIAEGLFHFIGRVAGWIVVDILLDIVFSLTGRLFLRVVTVGRYPPTEGDDYSESFIQVVGFLVLLSLAIAIAQWIDDSPGW